MAKKEQKTIIHFAGRDLDQQELVRRAQAKAIEWMDYQGLKGEERQDFLNAFNDKLGGIVEGRYQVSDTGEIMGSGASHVNYYTRRNHENKGDRKRGILGMRRRGYDANGNADTFIKGIAAAMPAYVDTSESSEDAADSAVQTAAQQAAVQAAAEKAATEKAAADKAAADKAAADAAVVAADKNGDNKTPEELAAEKEAADKKAAEEAAAERASAFDALSYTVDLAGGDLKLPDYNANTGRAGIFDDYNALDNVNGIQSLLNEAYQQQKDGKWHDYSNDNPDKPGNKGWDKQLSFWKNWEIGTDNNVAADGVPMSWLPQAYIDAVGEDNADEAPNDIKMRGTSSYGRSSYGVKRKFVSDYLYNLFYGPQKEVAQNFTLSATGEGVTFVIPNLWNFETGEAYTVTFLANTQTPVIKKQNLGDLIRVAKQNGAPAYNQLLAAYQKFAPAASEETKEEPKAAEQPEQPTDQPATAVETQKQGGILKAAGGASLLDNTAVSQATGPTNTGFTEDGLQYLQNSPTGGLSQEAYRAQQYSNAKGLSGSDYVHMAAAAADLTAFLTSFDPGMGTVASGVLGTASTLADLGADLFDPSVSVKSALANAGMNASLTAAGMLPGGGAAKVARRASQILGIALSVGGMMDLGDEAISGLTKMSKGQFHDLTRGEIRAMTAGVSSLAGLGTAGVNRYHTIKQGNASVQNGTSFITVKKGDTTAQLEVPTPMAAALAKAKNETEFASTVAKFTKDNPELKAKFDETVKPNFVKRTLRNPKNATDPTVHTNGDAGIGELNWFNRTITRPFNEFVTRPVQGWSPEVQTALFGAPASQLLQEAAATRKAAIDAAGTKPKRKKNQPKTPEQQPQVVPDAAGEQVTSKPGVSSDTPPADAVTPSQPWFTLSPDPKAQSTTLVGTVGMSGSSPVSYTLNHGTKINQDVIIGNVKLKAGDTIQIDPTTGKVTAINSDGTKVTTVYAGDAPKGKTPTENNPEGNNPEGSKSGEESAAAGAEGTEESTPSTSGGKGPLSLKPITPEVAVTRGSRTERAKDAVAETAQNVRDRATKVVQSLKNKVAQAFPNPIPVVQQAVSQPILTLTDTQLRRASRQQWQRNEKQRQRVQVANDNAEVARALNPVAQIPINTSTKEGLKDKGLKSKDSKLILQYLSNPNSVSQADLAKIRHIKELYKLLKGGTIPTFGDGGKSAGHAVTYGAATSETDGNHAYAPLVEGTHTDASKFMSNWSDFALTGLELSKFINAQRHNRKMVDLTDEMTYPTKRTPVTSYKVYYPKQHLDNAQAVLNRSTAMGAEAAKGTADSNVAFAYRLAAQKQGEESARPYLLQAVADQKASIDGAIQHGNNVATQRAADEFQNDTQRHAHDNQVRYAQIQKHAKDGTQYQLLANGIGQGIKMYAAANYKNAYSNFLATDPEIKNALQAARNMATRRDQYYGTENWTQADENAYNQAIAHATQVKNDRLNAWAMEHRQPVNAPFVGPIYSVRQGTSATPFDFGAPASQGFQFAKSGGKLAAAEREKTRRAAHKQFYDTQKLLLQESNKKQRAMSNGYAYFTRLMMQGK